MSALPWIAGGLAFEGRTPNGDTFDVFMRPKVEKIEDGYSFVVAPPNVTTSVVAVPLDSGQRLLDGTGLPPSFVPRTLFIKPVRPVQSTGANSLPELVPQGNPGVGNPNIVPVGTVQLEFSGLLEGAGSYIRRFGLAQTRMVRLNVAGVKDVNLTVIQSSMIGYGLRCVLTSREPTTGAAADRLFYAELYTANGLYRVPPGAVALTPSVAAAGFQWQQEDATGAQLILDAQVIGTRSLVKANKFLTNLVNFAAVWEIAP